MLILLMFQCSCFTATSHSRVGYAVFHTDNAGMSTIVKVALKRPRPQSRRIRFPFLNAGENDDTVRRGVPVRFAGAFLTMCVAFGVFLSIATAKSYYGTVTVEQNVSSLNVWVGTVSVFAAMMGGFLSMVLLLLVSRVPFLERVVGHDKLLFYHRWVAPAAVGAVFLHVVLVTFAWSANDGKGFFSEFAALTTQYSWMMPALVAFVLFMGLSLLSVRAVRNMFSYETWWVSHLYFYIAVLLGLGHQFVMSTPLSENTLLRNLWIVMIAGTFGILLYGRIVKPVMYNMRHRFVVERVVDETGDTVSLFVGGRNLDRLDVLPGQFFLWRLRTRRWWWQAHPYSLSNVPSYYNGQMRVTVKNLGDQSSSLAHILPGTKIWVEGPYGVFNKQTNPQNRVVCFAAGVGIAPIVSLLQGKHSSGTDVEVVYRVRETDQDEILFAEELKLLCSENRWGLTILPGGRELYSFTAGTVSSTILDPRTVDVYVCGSESFAETIQECCEDAGVPKSNIHKEEFIF